MEVRIVQGSTVKKILSEHFIHKQLVFFHPCCARSSPCSWLTTVHILLSSFVCSNDKVWTYLLGTCYLKDKIHYRHYKLEVCYDMRGCWHASAPWKFLDGTGKMQWSVNPGVTGTGKSKHLKASRDILFPKFSSLQLHWLPPEEACHLLSHFPTVNESKWIQRIQCLAFGLMFSWLNGKTEPE